MLAVAILLVGGLPGANAMGAAPTTCNNRYDGTITSFRVTYPGGTLDPMASPNSTFTLYGDTTYSVAFTVRTDALSSNHDSLDGTTWYDENVYGYYFGVCYPSENGTSVGPSQDVNISINGISHPCCSGYTVYQINFATLPQLQHPVSFKIRWEPASTTTTSSSPAASSTTSSLILSSTTSTSTSVSISSSTTSSTTTGGSTTTTPLPPALVTSSSSAQALPSSSAMVASSASSASPARTAPNGELLPLGLAAAMIFTIAGVGMLWLRRL